MKPTDWILKMSAWQTPEQMRMLVEDCAQSVGGTSILAKQGYGFWRDSWIAAEYSRLSKADQVRLINEDFPDFATSLKGVETQFEATEVLEHTRRRGDEIKVGLERAEAGLSTAIEDPPERWLTPETANHALNEASEKKGKKNYPSEIGLVIYLNWSDYFIPEDRIVSIMSDATKEVRLKFKSIDILWRQTVFHVWKNGRDISTT